MTRCRRELKRRRRIKYSLHEEAALPQSVAPHARPQITAFDLKHAVPLVVAHQGSNR
jgi:hypothetical protein